MKRHTYNNLEDRQFEMTDCLMGPDGGLLAAWAADNVISHLLEQGQGICKDDWDKARDEIARMSRITMWGLNCERLQT